MLVTEALKRLEEIKKHLERIRDLNPRAELTDFAQFDLDSLGCEVEEQLEEVEAETVSQEAETVSQEAETVSQEAETVINEILDEVATATTLSEVTILALHEKLNVLGEVFFDEVVEIRKVLNEIKPVEPTLKDFTDNGFVTPLDIEPLVTIKEDTQPTSSFPKLIEIDYLYNSKGKKTIKMVALSKIDYVIKKHKIEDAEELNIVLENYKKSMSGKGLMNLALQLETITGIKYDVHTDTATHTHIEEKEDIGLYPVEQYETLLSNLDGNFMNTIEALEYITNPSITDEDIALMGGIRGEDIAHLKDNFEAIKALLTSNINSNIDNSGIVSVGTDMPPMEEQYETLNINSNIDNSGIVSVGTDMPPMEEQELKDKLRFNPRGVKAILGLNFNSLEVLIDNQKEIEVLIDNQKEILDFYGIK